MEIERDLYLNKLIVKKENGLIGNILKKDWQQLTAFETCNIN